MTNLLALPVGTELAGDYRIERVIGAGGFGITYLAYEAPLARNVTIKEYFPADFAARDGDIEVHPRSRDYSEDYTWGLDRFIEEAQALAKFEHPNIVRVYRYFRSNSTGYMVLRFEEGQSFKAWLRGLGRAPRQAEIDAIVTPLLDALDVIHRADFLHRDIAPDNIILRKSGEPVLIDFGSARGDVAAHSRTVSALVKPGYSPYEQYATRSSQQGPWTDIYALAATLYQAITGKRPPDSPSRVVKDEYVPAKEAALASYRAGFLAAIDKALAVEPKHRPKSVAEWRGPLLAPEERKRLFGGRAARVGVAEGDMPAIAADPVVSGQTVPVPPDVPQAQGRFLDFIEGLRGRSGSPVAAGAIAAAASPPAFPPAVLKQAAAPQPRAPAPVLAPAKPEMSPAAAPPEARATRAPAQPRGQPYPWRRLLRPLAWKLLIGAGVASAAVAFQDHIPRIEIRGFGQVASQTSDAAEVLRLTGHKGAVKSVRLMDGGRTIVSVGSDHTLRQWSASTGNAGRVIALGGEEPSALAVGAAHAAVAYRDGEVQLWDMPRGERVFSARRNSAPIWSVALLSEPDRVVAGAHDWAVSLWDAGNAAQAPRVVEGHGNAVQAVAVSPERQLLLTGSADRTLKLWNSDTLALIRTYRGHREFVSAVAIAPGGRLVAGAALDGTIRIWSALSLRAERTLRGPVSRIGAIAFVPGRDVMVAGSDDGAIRLWDYKAGRVMRLLVGHSGPVRAIDVSSDGSRIVSAGDDGTVRVWDAALRPPEGRKS